MSADAASAANTAGAGLPRRYASGGSAIDASTDPNEMYRVVPAATKKIASAGPRASGISIANAPHAVATPFPPRKRTHTGCSVADHCGEGCHRRRGSLWRDSLREHHADGFLCNVEHGDQRAGGHPGRAHDVGGFEIAAAAHTKIADAPAPCDDQRERDRSEEIGGGGGDDHRRNWCQTPDNW